MKTLTLKIDERTFFGKAFLDLIMSFVKDKKIELVDSSEPVYDKEFVAMVKKSAASKKRYEVKDVNALWESL
jgi:hypothetical protein